jgi:hypothetical protein
MIEHVRKILAAQFEAALAMLNDCVQKCPPEQWDGLVAKYPFWQVAYHTLCFVDLYLSPSEKAFEMREIHPQGWREFNDEFPSRRFDKAELTAYLAICRTKAVETLVQMTEESFQADSGFGRLHISRGELHIYNLRHLQHHTGQLSAFLRRNDQAADPTWVGSGWK